MVQACTMNYRGNFRHLYVTLTHQWPSRYACSWH